MSITHTSSCNSAVTDRATVKYKHEVERAVVPFSLLLGFSADHSCATCRCLSRRTTESAQRFAMALSNWRSDLDIVGVRSPPDFVPHSDSVTESSTARDRQFVAPGTSRLAQRPEQSIGTSHVWLGPFVGLVWIDIRPIPELVFSGRHYGGNLGGFPLL